MQANLSYRGRHRANFLPAPARGANGESAVGMLGIRRSRAAPATHPCPAASRPRFRCGLPRQRSRRQKVESSALRPFARGAGSAWPGLRMTDVACHTLTPSHPHTLTPSHPHTLTPSHPHTLTPSHPHTLTPSHPHTLTPSHPHTLTPVHPVTPYSLASHSSRPAGCAAGARTPGAYGCTRGRTRFARTMCQTAATPSRQPIFFPSA